MRILAALLAGLALATTPVAASDPAAPDGEEVTEKILLSYQDPDSVIRLLSGDLRGSRGQKNAPYPYFHRSLVPEGIREILNFPQDKALKGVLSFPQDKALLIRGTQKALEAFRAGIRVVDAPMKLRGTEEATVTLKPERVDLEKLRESVLALPGAGTATIRKRELVLDGKLVWINVALRLAAEVEMGLKRQGAKEKGTTPDSQESR